MSRSSFWPLTGIVLLSLLSSVDARAESVILQSTTSTANTGFYDYILPIFTGATGIKVKVVVVGSGQAINNARNCNGDVLLVHAKEDEEAFVQSGYGVRRYDLMYNDFVIVGPVNDPADISASAGAVVAYGKIANSGALFVSRGDNSGTHKKSLSLWRKAEIDLNKASRSWFREAGAGMGTVLNMASALNAYTLSDRASWLRFANKRDLQLLYENDPILFNQYGVTLVNPDHCSNVAVQEGQKLIDWLLSDEGQNAIASFRWNNTPLFVPNAGSE